MAGPRRRCVLHLHGGHIRTAGRCPAPGDLGVQGGARDPFPAPLHHGLLLQGHPRPYEKGASGWACRGSFSGAPLRHVDLLALLHLGGEQRGPGEHHSAVGGAPLSPADRRSLLEGVEKGAGSRTSRRGDHRMGGFFPRRFRALGGFPRAPRQCIRRAVHPSGAENPPQECP